jgi:hypothetical protein
MGRIRSTSIALGLAFCQLACQVILTAPQGSQMFLTANPEFIPASGGVSIVSATLLEPEAGTPVADGTVVQFFTDLGRIEEQGRTNDGVARVKLVADARSGTAHVSAISGDASASGLVITIGAQNVATIVLRADPPRITNSNSTHVFAAVFDKGGNPVANVPVYFSVTSNPPTPATEFFDVNGPVYTNNNGEAENVLRTRRETQGFATVKAEVPGPGTSATLQIQIL